MTLLRRTLLAVLVAGGMVAVAAAPVGAGQPFGTVTGVATCNTTTFQYDITWTMTSNQGSSGPAITSATMTPPGSALTFSPNPVPGTTIPPGASTATANLPGTTAGVITAAVVIAAASPVTFTGTITLDGLCAPPVAVVAPVDFTG